MRSNTYLFTEWATFVMEKLETWRNMNLDWLRNFDKPLQVVYYEELIREPNRVIESIIPFLGLKPNKIHLRCMMRRKEGIYRRRKPFLPFDPFSPELRKVLDGQWKVIDNEVKKRRKLRMADG